MNNELLALKPKKLWFYFTEILNIPRPSKHEEKIAEYIVALKQDENRIKEFKMNLASCSKEFSSANAYKYIGN